MPHADIEQSAEFDPPGHLGDCVQITAHSDRIGYGKVADDTPGMCLEFYVWRPSQLDKRGEIWLSAPSQQRIVLLTGNGRVGSEYHAL